MKLYVVYGLMFFPYLINGNEFNIFDWNEYKANFNKQYTTVAEDNYRKKIFNENVKVIANHNELYKLGLTTFRLGLNEFADLSNYEFSKLMNKPKTYNIPITRTNDHNQDKYSNIPSSIDWRKKGFVTPVKNQVQCAGAGAISVAETVESTKAVKTGTLVPLSYQQIQDCCTDGCSGAVLSKILQCVVDMHGLDEISCYKFKSHDESCKYNKTCNGAITYGFRTVNIGDEAKLQEAVANSGPVGVSIDASRTSFQFYSDGVYDDPDCSSTSLNHNALIAGYGNDGNGHDYWLVENSWGTNWGLKGYIKMSRNKQNQCGIATATYYPIL